MPSTTVNRKRNRAKGKARFEVADSAVITDPLTGRAVSTEDVDGLVDLFEQLVKVDRAVYAAKSEICRTLAAKTNGEGRVRRLHGGRRTVRVELPPDAWDQAQLRALWRDFPDLRTTYLRIDAIGVQLRALRELLGTVGLGDVEAFKIRLLAARKLPTACPRVTIEE